MKLEEKVAAVLAKGDALAAAVNKAFLKSHFDPKREEWSIEFADGELVNAAVVEFEKARVEDEQEVPQFIDGENALPMREVSCSRCGAPAAVSMGSKINEPVLCEACDRSPWRKS